MNVSSALEVSSNAPNAPNAKSAASAAMATIGIRRKGVVVSPSFSEVGCEGLAEFSVEYHLQFAIHLPPPAMDTLERALYIMDARQT